MDKKSDSEEESKGNAKEPTKIEVWTPRSADGCVIMFFVAIGFLGGLLVGALAGYARHGTLQGACGGAAGCACMGGALGWVISSM